MTHVVHTFLHICSAHIRQLGYLNKTASHARSDSSDAVEELDRIIPAAAAVTNSTVTKPLSRSGSIFMRRKSSQDNNGLNTTFTSTLQSFGSNGSNDWSTPATR
jgi:hypothetical protein